MQLRGSACISPHQTAQSTHASGQELAQAVPASGQQAATESCPVQYGAPQLTGVQASPWNPALHLAHVHRFSVYVSQLLMTGHTSQTVPDFE